MAAHEPLITSEMWTAGILKGLLMLLSFPAVQFMIFVVFAVLFLRVGMKVLQRMGL